MAGTPDPGTLFQFQKPAPGSPTLAEEVRDNFTALVQNNLITAQSDPTKVPPAPKDGMRRINAVDPNNVKDEVYFNGNWRTVFQKLNLGNPAPAKIIVQVTVPQSVWTIDHNLGGLVIVQVLNDSLIQRQNVPSAPNSDQYILQHVITPTVQRIIITHPFNTTGWVIISG